MWRESKLITYLNSQQLKFIHNLYNYIVLPEFTVNSSLQVDLKFANPYES